MNQLQTNVNDIKSVAKILKKELADMDFKLSHSSALNLASRALGFKNYQTYKGLFDKDIQPKKHFSRPFSEVKKEVEEKRLNLYPRIYNMFVKMGHTQQYDIHIERELSDDEYNYFLIFELKNSYTGRVFFSPQYNTFSLYVYPEVKNPDRPYDFQIEGGEDFYFRIIKHLNRKSWMERKLLGDLMNLMETIKRDRIALIDIVNNHSKEELERRYKEVKND